MGALDGLRILDLSSVLMGPLAARILGDMGAEVIKVEAPGGDTLRAIGPMRHPGMGPMFMHANRNKRSIALDLKHPEGKAAVMKLIERSDALVCNVRPAAMQRLGLDYAACRAVKPDLVYVAAVGFGQDGPYAPRPAFDDLVQGMCALPSMLATASNGAPHFIPMSLVDRHLGAHVANAVLGALVHRLRTGQGQMVEVPMFETLADAVLGDHLGGASFEPPISPPGYARALAPERRPYRTKDGYVCANVYTDAHWRAFLKLVGSDLMDTDPAFASITTRMADTRRIHGLLEGWLATRSTAEWLEALAAADIPAVPLATLEGLADDPHLVATGFVTTVEHPSEGAMRTTRPAARWSATPAAVSRQAPRLGEHTREILAELGYAAADIERLTTSGAARAA